VTVSAAAARISTEEMLERFLPALLRTTDLISMGLARGAPPGARAR
jgi:hypothetical protein